ncbi:tetratricopeptide repeat protein [bacterium]|nr:tetratricopeptide repeat protein [bacterium]
MASVRAVRERARFREGLSGNMGGVRERGEPLRIRFLLVAMLIVAGAWSSASLAHDGSARHNKADEQIVKLTEHLRDEPDDMDALRERGNLYYNVNEEYESALEDFEHWVKVLPQGKPGHGARAFRAAARYHTGDWKGALADLDPICSASTTFENAWFTRSELRRDLGDTAGARSDIDRALEVHLAHEKAKAWPLVYVRRAQLREAQGDEDGALKDYDAALGKDPRHVPALLGRALLHVSAGRFEDATADIVTADGVAKDLLETIPTALVHAARARKDRKQGYAEAAKREVEAAVLSYRKEAQASRSPHRAAEVLRDAARLVFEAANDARGALALVEDALKLAPERVDLLREKVRFLDSLGEKETCDTARKTLARVESLRLP